MHRIDTDGHVANLFDEGDPGVPRLPTVIDSEILNAFQEEPMAILTEAGIAPIKNTNTQVRDSLRVLYLRVLGAVAQTVTGIKTFTSRMLITVTDNADAALMVSNNGTDTGVEIGTNTGIGIDVASSGSTNPTARIQSIGSTAAALELTAPDGRWPLKFTPRPTLPTLNPAGGALSAADDGAIVYLNGAFNKLYCYTHPTGWVALS